MGKYLRISSYIRKPSYMTSQLLHSEFLIYEEIFILFFISVILTEVGPYLAH